MYNHKQIENFIDKVHKEATEAAQKVYDKYNTELNERIQKSMLKGHNLTAGMGLVSICNAKGDHIADNFTDELTQCEYWDKVSAGFTIEDFKK